MGFSNEQIFMMIFFVFALVNFAMRFLNKANSSKDVTEGSKLAGEIAPTQGNYDMINTVSKYKQGTPQFIEVFGTHCPPCRAQVPHLVHMQNKNKNVYFLSVSTESEEAVKTFLQSNEKAKELNIALDSGKAMSGIMQRAGVYGIPHCFIFDKTGKLVWHGHPGQSDAKAAELNKEASPFEWSNSGNPQKL